MHNTLQLVLEAQYLSAFKQPSTSGDDWDLHLFLDTGVA